MEEGESETLSHDTAPGCRKSHTASSGSPSRQSSKRFVSTRPRPSDAIHMRSARSCAQREKRRSRGRLLGPGAAPITSTGLHGRGGYPWTRRCRRMWTRRCAMDQCLNNTKNGRPSLRYESRLETPGARGEAAQSRERARLPGPSLVSLPTSNTRTPPYLYRQELPPRRARTSLLSLKSRLTGLAVGAASIAGSAWKSDARNAVSRRGRGRRTSPASSCTTRRRTDTHRLRSTVGAESGCGACT
eukprot:5312232-Pleurochrysis_carterae.AAC.2